MNITRGGRFSILIAALNALGWGIRNLAGDSLNETQGIAVGVIVGMCSFPLGHLIGFFYSHGSFALSVKYVLLMTPNSFLLGYSLAGILKVTNWTHDYFRKKV